MEQVTSSARSTDSIVVAPEHHDTWHNTPPLAVASALPLPLASIKKPHKLTPLEKKERDRLRMKEQSQRRKQAIKDQYDQAKRFAQQKRSSASWHQQERLEEELVLRRLERDAVEPQRSHPAAAGYYFDDTAQKSSPASKATQRLKTPKTTFQEEEDAHSSLTDVDPLQNTTSTSQDDENNFYSSVLPDFRAIRKFRALSQKLGVVLVRALSCQHRATQPTFAYSAANHTRLFYLDEHIASATYTRNGVVNGELLLEDFNLQKTAPPRSDRADAVGDNNNNSEFLLFAVAILHPQSTPQLVLNYVHRTSTSSRQKTGSQPASISVDSKDNGGLPQWTRLVPATFLLPKAVDQDPFQVQIRPHIHAMHVFAKTNYAIIAAEQREERERLLCLSPRSKGCQARIEEEASGSADVYGLDQGSTSIDILRIHLRDTSNPRQPRVAEERLGKLWQFMQMLEEWKILKGGRLLDIERSDATMSLMQQLKETASVAFNQMMFGTKTLKGGGTLPYPVLCLEGSGTTRKLVLRLGTRMGVTQQDDHDYGMVLNLDQDFEALEKDEPKRGYMKRVAADQETRDEQMNKGRSSSTMALLVSSSDLLSPPFHRIKWPLIVKAYKLVLKHRLQTADAVLSKAQLMKWQADVDHFLATLHENCALKGVAVLKRRAQARRKQLRDREKELERLRELHLERDRPKLTLAQQLKVAFMKERAPQLREAVELTPAEKLGARLENSGQSCVRRG
ncbi:hypothetical protein GQ600_4348 [Phytophthora cactorum]|nr:hypothetical protein GQ600_4348 [Phytophthora cactorum]